MMKRGLDQAKSEAFAGQMVRVLNDAAVALMTSVGYQVGLFDTIGLGHAFEDSKGFKDTAKVVELVTQWFAETLTY